MSPSATQAVRWIRALLLASVAHASGSLAHVSAGGVMPGLVGATAVLVSTTLAAAFFLGRRASTTRIVVLLLAAQTFVHGALSVLGGHGPGPHARADHGLALASATVDVWEHLAVQDLRMVLGHLLATVALGLWLSVGERALFTVLGLLAAPIVDLGRRLAMLRLAVLAGPLALLRSLLPGAHQHRLVPLVPSRVTHAVVRRGPPLPLAA